MNNKIYILSTCSTCSRILKELAPLGDMEIINIKTDNITEVELNYVAKQHGSYEAVFSKRAMKYRSLGLKEMSLGEGDYKRYILEEYTFLKRPIAIIDGQSYVGNSKKVVEQMKKALHG